MDVLEYQRKIGKEEMNNFIWLANSDERYNGTSAECEMVFQIIKQMGIPLVNIRPGPPINENTLMPDPNMSATQTGIYIKSHGGTSSQAICLGDAVEEYSLIKKHRCTFVLNPDYRFSIKKSGE